MTKRAAEAEKTVPDWATLRRLAVKASCDPRTIRKLLEGEVVAGLAGDRARAVLVEEGLLKEASK